MTQHRKSPGAATTGAGAEPSGRLNSGTSIIHYPEAEINSRPYELNLLLEGYFAARLAGDFDRGECLAANYRHLLRQDERPDPDQPRPLTLPSKQEWAAWKRVQEFEARLDDLEAALDAELEENAEIAERLARLTL